MTFVSYSGLVQAEKAEDEQDDDHKADEIDDAVHGASLTMTIHHRIVRVQIKGFPLTSSQPKPFHIRRQI